VFVLASTELVILCPAIDNPASCEIRAGIRFLHINNMSDAEIIRDLYAVHSQNITIEGTTRQLCRMLKDGRKKCSR
jgi:hypothetical protein